MYLQFRKRFEFCSEPRIKCGSRHGDFKDTLRKSIDEKKTSSEHEKKLVDRIRRQEDESSKLLGAPAQIERLTKQVQPTPATQAILPVLKAGESGIIHF